MVRDRNDLDGVVPVERFDEGGRYSSFGRGDRSRAAGRCESSSLHRERRYAAPHSVEDLQNQGLAVADSPALNKDFTASIALLASGEPAFSSARRTFAAASGL